MAKLRAGVIGLGMGWNHLVGYMNHPDVEVVAVADRRAKFLTVLENVVLESDENIHIEPLAPGKIRIHGSKVGKLYTHYRNNNVKELIINFTTRPFTDITLE